MTTNRKIIAGNAQFFLEKWYEYFDAKN